MHKGYAKFTPLTGTDMTAGGGRALAQSRAGNGKALIADWRAIIR